MTYLALTQATAEWLQGKTGLLDELHHSLVNDLNDLRALTTIEFVEGPIRVSASKNGDVVAIWNSDYLTGTGEESWGLIRIDGEISLQKSPDISREVLERCIYVINQRLQGLMIDAAFYHHSYQNSSHTCLAGRGSAARQVSVGYFERIVGNHDIEQRSLVCIGPSRERSTLAKDAEKAGGELDSLAESANSLIEVGRQRSIAGINVLSKLRGALLPYTKRDVIESNSDEYKEVKVATGQVKYDSSRSIGLSYYQWLQPTSQLSDIQRRILNSDAITKHPLRIVGPGGSGKTLLMQLLALKRLYVANDTNSRLRILYIVHNDAMSKMVMSRFELLAAESIDLNGVDRSLKIITLSEYGRAELGLDFTSIIDPDAYEAKLFQLEKVSEALKFTMEAMPDIISNSRLLQDVENNAELFPILARLVMAEISTAIKGHGLTGDS